MGTRQTTSKFTFDAIGTQWEIETQEPLSPRLEHHILERIQQFDATYSRFRPDSLVSRVAAARIKQQASK